MVPLRQAPLKYYRGMSYSVIGITHDLYSNCLCLGFSPLAEFPRESIVLITERALCAYYFECSLKRSFRSKKKSKYFQTLLEMREVIPVYGAYLRSTGGFKSSCFLEK